MTEPWHGMSISRLAPRLARREVSPVEVTAQLLQRIRERDGELHAYLLLDEAGAMAQAREAEARLGRGKAHSSPAFPWP